MSDGNRSVTLAHIPYPIRPNGIGQVSPIVISCFELLPALLKVFAPFREPEKLPERGRGDQNAIVEIWLVWEVGDPSDLVSKVPQFVEQDSCLFKCGPQRQGFAASGVGKFRFNAPKLLFDVVNL